MDLDTYVNKRKGRYMAQTLDAFEQMIEPHLPADAAGDVQAFKGLCRARFNSLANDAVEASELEQNGVAQELRDRLSPVGRP